MRFDREKLEALASMPDDKLWAEVVRIADSFGYSLPRETPPHSELEKMRSAARAEKINVSEALRLVNQYKRK
jgi:hypothetical protein